VCRFWQPFHAGSIERAFTRYHGYIPACDDPWALRTIAARFDSTERRFWASYAWVSDIYDVREIAYRPWGPDFIPRRYCKARVRISEAKKTLVYYSIIESGGFAGASWGVEWCVVGYDRQLAYAPNCKMARP
jgi:hypothetical protein